MPEILLAGPGELDRHAGACTGDLHRLPHEVGLPLAAETAAEERHLQRTAVPRQSRDLHHDIAGPVGLLRRRPEHGAAVRHQGGGAERLERGVRDERDLVGPFELPRGAGDRPARRVEVVADAGRCARRQRSDVVIQRGAQTARHTRAVDAARGGGVEHRGGMLADGGRGLHRMPCRARQHGDAVGDRDGIDDARRPQYCVAIERDDLAGDGARTEDRRMQHAGHPDIDPELRRPRDLR